MNGVEIRTIGLAVGNLEDGIQTIAFADNPESPGPYVILTRSDVATEEERARGEDCIYLEIDDQIRADYDAVESIVIAPGRITIIIKSDAQTRIGASRVDLVLKIGEELEAEVAEALFAMCADANVAVKGPRNDF